jgi:hypothetical protein
VCTASGSTGDLTRRKGRRWHETAATTPHVPCAILFEQLMTPLLRITSGLGCVSHRVSRIPSACAGIFLPMCRYMVIRTCYKAEH